MNIVLTASISNVGRPLTRELVSQGHSVKVITSKVERVSEIESLGATAAVGSMMDVDFLSATFKDADIVYLMETLDAVGGDFGDKDADLMGAISQIGQNYKQAVLHSGVKKIVHLSSIGAHMKKGNGFLQFHRNVETILNQLPTEVSIKFMRPVGFYTNMFGLFLRRVPPRTLAVGHTSILSRNPEFPLF
jgi:uncharacterized protein YbjT (DUF2867 family)